MSGTRPDSRPAPATSGSALLIAAHGDCGGEGGDLLANELARRVRQSRCYDEVAIGFMRGKPAIEEAAARIASARIRIYPLFMSDGYYAHKAIPERLGIHDGVDALGHQVAIDPPLGLNPELPQLLAKAAAQSAQSAGIQPASATLLLVAHGSRSSGHSADAARAILQVLSDAGAFARAELAFLEQEPAFAGTLTSCARPTVVLGLFTGRGMHAEQDVRTAVQGLDDGAVILVEQLGGYAPIIELVASELCSADDRRSAE